MTTDYAALRALAEEATKLSRGVPIVAPIFTPETILALLDDLEYWKVEYEAALANWKAHIETDNKLNAEIRRLRSAIREAIAFLEDDPPEVNIRGHINALRAALAEGGEGE